LAILAWAGPFAFTSDAKTKWAQEWLNCPKYRQFWSAGRPVEFAQAGERRFWHGCSVDRGEGTVSVEALDGTGNFRNFLNLARAW
jgi:hypothetical protein